MHALPLVDRLSVRIPQTLALCASAVSSSFRRPKTFPRLSSFFFFDICSSSLDGKGQEDFFVSFRVPGNTEPQGSAILHVNTFPLVFSFLQNERTSNASAIDRKKSTLIHAPGECNTVELKY